MKHKNMLLFILLYWGITGFASAEDDADAETKGNRWYGYCQAAAFQDYMGDSELCITPGGLRGKMKVTNLVPGDAYTVWWVYFDDPGQCETPFQCGAVDFSLGQPEANPVGVFGRMDSGIANHRGKLRFRDFLDDMHPTSGSQVWLLIFGHGQADMGDGRKLARQLLTPEDPAAGAPHLGIQDDPAGFPVGVAVFAIE